MEKQKSDRFAPIGHETCTLIFQLFEIYNLVYLGRPDTSGKCRMQIRVGNTGRYSITADYTFSITPITHFVRFGR